MAYCTVVDLYAAFGEREIVELSDRAGSGVVDAAVISAAIDRASDEIDGYCRARYAVPLPPSEQIKGVCCDLTRYYLWDDAVDERVHAGYEQAIEWLRRVAAGEIVLDAPTADEPARRPASLERAMTFTQALWETYPS